jgi:hypothetical protein
MIVSSRPAVVAALLCACALWVSPLFAQSVSGADRATADALFREGKRLMAKRQFSEACPKLEESQRLDPQGGTLLNLAVCHAREGKTASAWSEFQEALALAREAKRNDRIRLAKRELAQLSPRLSHLVIQVPSESRVEGLEVKRGSSSVPEAAWGVAVPVDPGEFEIVARAPGHREWATRVTVEEAERSSVSVPELEKLPPPPSKPPADKPRPAPEPVDDDGSTQRLIGFVVGGVGIAALGVGGYFGLRAIDKANQSDEHCNGSLCDRAGLDLNDEADQAATIANVSMAIGVAGIGIGTYLVLSAPGGKERRTTALSASAGTNGATVLLSGAW